MKNTLTAYSGGVDSLFVLWRLLRFTDDHVTAFRMDMSDAKFTEPGVSLRPLAVAENIVVPKIFQWLTSNIRPFELRTIPISALDPNGWISLTMLNTALAIVHAEPFDRFVYSRSLENDLSANRLQWLKSIWAANTDVPMETPLIDKQQGRPHAMSVLPRELQALMFSCDHPKINFGDPVGCRDCIKCKVTLLARGMLADGIDPDIIFDYYLKKMGVGPYLGAITADPALQPKKRYWISYPEGSK